MHDFTSLNLKPAIAQALAELGFEKPTPIQQEALPVLLGEDTDFLGLAATGTGKTAAFGIPLLEKIDAASPELAAVVLCPTRELAVQTANGLTALGAHLGIEVPAIYGGAGGYPEQFAQLKRSVIIVATPGRLVDHLARGSVSLASVKWLVLDEADRMISMGFKEELEKILEATSREHCRTWLFSATMPPYLRDVAEQYLDDPSIAQVNGQEVLSGTVRQLYYSVRDKNKPKGLAKLIDAHEGFYGLVFCQTKALVMEVTEYLRQHGHQVDCLHGDKHQRDRERTLAHFRDRKVNILVCTDVAARGLDVQDLTHVINYSLPYDTDSYIHRIGRTGRNGKEGIAMSLVGPDQMRMIPRIEKRTRTKWESARFPTRRDIGAVKLSQLLPRFEAADPALAQAAIGEEWAAKLESMSKQEIAGRFLALTHPQLFSDTVEETLHEPEGRGDRQRRYDERPRRFDREDRPGRHFERDERPRRRFDRDDRPGRRFDREDRPARFARAERPQHAERSPGAIEVPPPEMETEETLTAPPAEPTFAAQAAQVPPPREAADVPAEAVEAPPQPVAEAPAPAVPAGIPAPEATAEIPAQVATAAAPDAVVPAEEPFSPPDEPYERKSPRRDHPRSERFAKPHGKRFDSIVDVDTAEQEFVERKTRGIAPKGKEIGKPFMRRREDGGKPYFVRREDEARPFSRRPGEGKPFRRGGDDRPFFKRGGEGKPFFRRDGEERPFFKRQGARPFFKRRDEEGGGEDRPFYPRKQFGEGFPRKQYGEGRPFGKKPFGDRPFGKPAFGKKPFGKPGFGKKPFGKPAFGDRPFGKPAFGKKPFGKPGFGKPFGKKPFGKPAGFGPRRPDDERG